MQALTANVFAEYIAQGCTIVDLRDVKDFKQGFIKDSILVASGIKFKDYYEFFKGKEPLLVVCYPEEKDSSLKLIQDAGFKNIAGFLEHGFASWLDAQNPIDVIIDVEADELMMDLPYDDNLVIMDIRSPLTFASGHLKESVNLPLADMTDVVRLSAIDDHDNIYIVGNNDEEVFLAASLLKRHEFHNLRVVIGGWQALEQQPNVVIEKEPGMLN
ncbi:Thiosulfate sulfurtransferase GlpE [Mycovorax composti]|uniref:Thiosulfate sulfurtransferase GlpE n=2 Tax=Chitinophagaceae TaxID=563835 RepID=A0ABZ2EH83_9BACT